MAIIGKQVMNIRDRFASYALFLRTVVKRGGFRQWRHVLICEMKALMNSEQLPRQAVIGLTNRCQCHCAHCCIGMYDVNPSEEPTFDELHALLRRLHKLGVSFITWFGGEPLLREDLPALVADAYSLGMFTTIETNGLLLDEEMVRELRSAGLSRFCISLDSADREVHDSNRVYPGCFDAACNAVRIASDYKMPCVVSVTVQRELLRSGDVGRLIELARELGASSVRLIPPISTGRWITHEEVQLTREDQALLWGVNQPGFTYVEHILNNTGNVFYCDAAHLKKFYISCSGDVHPCEFVPVSFGNVRKEDIDPILARMRSYPDIKQYCGNCITHCNYTRELVTAHLAKGESLPVQVRDIDNG